ncbi:MAG: hypothetical protein OXC03_08870 [Flavobacteriaceae bacterium]|nr:hypothetical protein [Flavobacteriaceae bacterium]
MSIHIEDFNFHPNVYKRLAEAKKNSDATNDALLEDLKKGSRPICFWDRIIDILNRGKNKKFIIQRIVQWSFPKDFDDNMDMLEKYYTKEEIIDSVANPLERIDRNILQKISKRYGIKPIPYETMASRGGKTIDIKTLFLNNE